MSLCRSIQRMVFVEGNTQNDAVQPGPPKLTSTTTIDYILISGDPEKVVKSAAVLWQPRTSLRTDHALVVAELDMRTWTGIGNREKKCNTKRLTREKSYRFKITAGNQKAAWKSYSEANVDRQETESEPPFTSTFTKEFLQHRFSWGQTGLDLTSTKPDNSTTTKDQTIIIKLSPCSTKEEHEVRMREAINEYNNKLTDTILRIGIETGILEEIAPCRPHRANTRTRPPPLENQLYHMESTQGRMAKHIRALTEVTTQNPSTAKKHIEQIKDWVSNVLKLNDQSSAQPPTKITPEPPQHRTTPRERYHTTINEKIPDNKIRKQGIAAIETAKQKMEIIWKQYQQATTKPTPHHTDPEDCRRWANQITTSTRTLVSNTKKVLRRVKRAIRETKTERDSRYAPGSFYKTIF